MENELAVYVELPMLKNVDFNWAQLNAGYAHHKASFTLSNNHDAWVYCGVKCNTITTECNLDRSGNPQNDSETPFQCLQVPHDAVALLTDCDNVHLPDGVIFKLSPEQIQVMNDLLYDHFADEFKANSNKETEY